MEVTLGKRIRDGKIISERMTLKVEEKIDSKTQLSKWKKKLKYLNFRETSFEVKNTSMYKKVRLKLFNKGRKILANTATFRRTEMKWKQLNICKWRKGEIYEYYLVHYLQKISNDFNFGPEKSIRK